MSCKFLRTERFFVNIEYLLRRVSQQLHTIVRQYGSRGERARCICERVGFQDRLHEPAGRKAALRAVGGVPLIYSTGAVVTYAAVDAGSSCLLVGPVLLSDGQESLFTLSVPESPSAWLEQVYRCSCNALFCEVLLLYNLFHTQTISSREILAVNYGGDTMREVQKEFSELVFEQQETGTKHNPYDQEVREMSSVRSGDVQRLKKSWAEDYVGNLGVLAKDRLRSFKNLAIVLVTLVSRAAIEGGILPEDAFSLSDSYIRKIEELQSPDLVTQVGRQAEYQYTCMVHAVKERKKNHAHRKTSDPRVEQCKAYIYTHLHEKISIAQIAEKLQMHPNSLSALFKSCEGVPMRDFILDKKVDLAKNLLMYSPYSFSEIAAYLGFSSQSHLGTQFKKRTGVTLRQYRAQYRVQEFLDGQQEHYR